jgi:hypothetical protein
MGNTTIQAPTPSAQESAIYDMILSQINQYNDYNQMMMPIQMQQAGYKWEWKPEYLDEEGNVIETSETVDNPEAIAQKAEYEKQIKSLQDQLAYLQQSNTPEAQSEINNIQNQIASIQTKINALELTTTTEVKPQMGSSEYGSWVEMDDEEYYNSLNTQEKLQYDLQKAQAERSLAAIEGTLEFSPALEEQRQKEWDQLKEVYGTIEGDSWDTATASDTVGQQNLDQFKRRWTMMEEAVRHGQAGSDVQSAAIASGLTTGQTANKIGTTQALGSGYGASIPMYQSVLNPLQQYNMGGWQTNVYNAANQSAQSGSLLGAGSSILTTALLLARMSSRDFKTDIKKQTKADEDRALKLILKNRSYKYKYKPEMGLGNDPQLGPIVEESPREIVAPGGKAINLGNTIELQSMAIKALARKLEKRRSA